MRDLRKLRTKYEIKLDNRHIAYLLAGAVVLVAIFFSLGIVVGKGMGQLDEVAKGAAASPTPVAAADKGATDPAYKGSVDSLLHDDAGQPSAPAPLVEPTPPSQAMQTPPPTSADLAPALPPGANQVDIGSLPALPKGGDFWTVQVGSYPTKEEAMATYNRMLQGGNQPKVETADLGERGTWYRVSVGQFATEAGARAVAEALREREKMDTWVRFVP